MIIQITKEFKQNERFFNDDKNIVIIAVLILGLALIFDHNINAEVLKAITPIFTGLFELAIGKSLGGNK